VLPTLGLAGWKVLSKERFLNAWRRLKDGEDAKKAARISTTMAELTRWCREQRFSGVMTDAVIKAFGDLDSLRSCANDLGLVNEGLEGLPPVPRKKVVAAIRALAEPGAAPASESA